MKIKYIKIILIFFIIIFLGCLLINTRKILHKSEKISKMLYGDPINIENGLINNKYFNIYNDNTHSKETTEGINKAIEYASKNNIEYLKFEKGIYLIDGETAKESFGETDEEKGIILKSNITLNLNGATFKHIQTSRSNYAIFSVTNVQNVQIYNGIIIGDKDEHIFFNNSGTHEWGFGIDIRGNCDNIEIKNMQIYNLTGDGVFIGNNPNKTFYCGIPHSIVVSNCNIYSCRRQGISIVCGDNIKIEQNSIHNIAGTSPQLAIDLETWDEKQKIDNIEINDNKIYNINNSENMSIGVMGNSYKINIHNNQLENGICISKCIDLVNIYDNIIKSGNIWISTSSWAEPNEYQINKVILKNNLIDNARIYIDKVKDIVIEKNEINNTKMQVISSNAAIIDNIYKSEENTMEYAIMYFIWNVDREMYMYLYNNSFIGKYSVEEEWIKNSKLYVIRDLDSIKKYLKEINYN